MLVEEGELRGLIGPRSLRLWSRHQNSAAVLDFLPKKGQIWMLVPGGGFPGIVRFVAQILMSILPSRWRDVANVLLMLDTLGLDNVSIHQARAEELRAVWPMW